MYVVNKYAPGGSGQHTGVAPGAGADRAGQFAARIPGLLERYAARLGEIGSPLVTKAAVWEQCELQARQILDDCARSLATGASAVTQVVDIGDLSSDRVRHGIHPIHSVRAGRILSDLAMSAIAEFGTQTGAADLAGVLAAVCVLQQAIGMRLESGAIGYDAFLLQRVREVNQQGQRRLAREIHDHIGNSASLALRQIELYELECERAADGSELGTVSRHIDLAKDAVMETMARSRELVSELRRPDISGSLETALRGFAASLGQNGAPVEMRVRGSDAWISGAVTEELFIMVRECLRNAYTHANAAKIVVQIDIAPHEVHAEIIDNGAGFDVEALRADGLGNGLLILQERSDLLRGSANIDSAPGRGTRVTLSIPIDQERLST